MKLNRHLVAYSAFNKSKYMTMAFEDFMFNPMGLYAVLKHIVNVQSKESHNVPFDERD